MSRLSKSGLLVHILYQPVPERRPAYISKTDILGKKLHSRPC
jgi:hypothetical protein